MFSEDAHHTAALGAGGERPRFLGRWTAGAGGERRAREAVDAIAARCGGAGERGRELDGFLSIRRVSGSEPYKGF